MERVNVAWLLVNTMGIISFTFSNTEKIYVNTNKT